MPRTPGGTAPNLGRGRSAAPPLPYTGPPPLNRRSHSQYPAPDWNHSRFLNVEPAFSETYPPPMSSQPSMVQPYNWSPSLSANPPGSKIPSHNQPFTQTAATNYYTVQPPQGWDMGAANGGQDLYTAQQGGSQPAQNQNYYPTYSNGMPFDGTYQYPGY
jgi:hypothetical protein